MAADPKLTDRVREALAGQKKLEEKTMFRGICFMVNGKMCICVSRDELMCRIGPDGYETAMEKNGVRPMINNGKAMKGFVYVNEEGYKGKKNFDYWVNACLSFNKLAKASKKPAAKKRKRPI
jgi:TfoX/Sxy family transcriptional regulator of competence genes